jgi:hypothetical protein
MKRGYAAIDLEAIPASLRSSVAKSITPNSGTIVGAANMQPQNFRNGVLHAGLEMHWKSYQARRDARDRDNPNKANQMDLKQASQWMRSMADEDSPYDVVFDATQSLDEMFSDIEFETYTASKVSTPEVRLEEESDPSNMNHPDHDEWMENQRELYEDYDDKYGA